FLGAEVVGERPLGGVRLGHDLAHAGAHVALAEHDPEAGVEDVVAERGACHDGIIRSYVLIVKPRLPEVGGADFTHQPETGWMRLRWGLQHWGIGWGSQTPPSVGASSGGS